VKTDKKVAKALKEEIDARVAELTEELNKKISQIQQAQQVAENLKVQAIELQGALKNLQYMREPDDHAPGQGDRAQPKAPAPRPPK
jgi:LPS O-antigen subunit length determinant protein (WzzB/FepE family)